MPRGLLLLSALVAAVTIALPGLQAQGLTPMDDKEGARFQAVSKALSASGYGAVMIVAHGGGSSDALFVATGEKARRGVLALVLEPGRTPAMIAELENADTPAAFGFRGAEFSTPFLGVTDLTDVETRHQPFMLETSSSYSMHHLVRRQGATVTKVCEFRGNQQSSTSKGIGSMSSKHTVTPAKAAAKTAGAFGFDLVVVDEATQTSPGQQPQTTRQESRVHYELPSGGQCTMGKS